MLLSALRSRAVHHRIDDHSRWRIRHARLTPSPLQGEGRGEGRSDNNSVTDYRRCDVVNEYLPDSTSCFSPPRYTFAVVFTGMVTSSFSSFPSMRQDDSIVPLIDS